MAKAENNISTHVNFGFPGRGFLSCGYMPNEEVCEYLKKLAGQDLNKEHYCVQCGFSFDGYPYDKSFKQVLFVKARFQTNKDSRPDCGARTVGGCFRKLKKGECKDPFVIENIGKVFWSEKYEKQK